jgi:5-methylcytosine-specific restriction endonuclease McrA
MGRLRWYIREEVLERDNYHCQICGSNHLLEIHHIRHFSNGCDNRPQNLITVCHTCHKVIHCYIPNLIPSGVNPLLHQNTILDYVSMQEHIAA